MTDQTVLDANTRLARDYFKAFADRDAAWWQDHIDPGFIRHDPGLPFEVRGHAGMLRLAELLHGAFSDIELPISHTVAQDDLVLVHLRLVAVHAGDLNGIAATGRPVDIAVMDLFRIEGKKIVEHWALLDNLGMLTQIGAMG